jgi:hypothetical protein
MIAWLSAHASVVSGLASAVSAFAAVVIMCATIATVALNRRLAKENRTLRKAEGDPQVVAYATINPRVYAAIDFVIANIGKGPAREISYRIIAGGEDLKAKDVRMLPAEVNYAFLPADEQLSTWMGMGWDLLAEPRISPFEIELTYENLAGEKRTGRFKIDVGQFDGMGRLGAPTDEQIADHLKMIATTMEGWATRRLQVEIMSVTERKEHDEQMRRMIEERRASAVNPHTKQGANRPRSREAKWQVIQKFRNTVNNTGCDPFFGDRTDTFLDH